MTDPNTLIQKLERRLRFIYKDNYQKAYAVKLNELIEKYKTDKVRNDKWNEKDVVLITYGDSIHTNGEPPLITLKRFLDNKLNDLITIVHILPFFPYSSDDGFSVIDFREVDPKLGSWNEIEQLTGNYDLMADLVINHASSQGEWFLNFIKQEGKGRDFFITEDPETDLSNVVRPRSSPLLTKVETTQGEKHVWTTFSADQVDLNFANPEVLFEMTDIMLSYISKGARVIRLDAIAFLWKRAGTSCLHLPETHEVVKLLREIAEAVNSSVIILTETNVPNKENLSYFGKGDEAHMVYQFSLPPLLLHAMHHGTSEYLVQWAESLPEPPEDCTFYNFTASHDGIGLRPLEGIIPEKEVHLLAEKMQQFGGKVNYRSTTAGGKSPYELNITYFDAMRGTASGMDDHQASRFLASQTIMMAFRGIPAFYIHSLTSTPNDQEGVERTGENRSINRRKWKLNDLNYELENVPVRKQVLHELISMIALRTKQKAFHPDAPQKIVDLGKNLFGFLRISHDMSQELLCITNLTPEEQKVDLPPNHLAQIHDIISQQMMTAPVLKPYQSVWLSK